MSDTRKSIFILFIFYAVAMLICILRVIQAVPNVKLLPPLQFKYYFATFAELFIQSFSAVTFTGIIFSYTRVFAELHVDSHTNINYEHFFGSIIRQLCIVAVIFATTFFLLQEIALPIAINSKQSIITISHTYENSYKEFIASQLSSNYLEKRNRLSKLLAISAHDKDLVAHYDRMTAKESATESSLQANTAIQTNTISKAPHIIQTGKSFSFTTALERAETAFQNQLWFDAHYYASIAIKLAENNNPDMNHAKSIASKAWNAIAGQSVDMATQKNYMAYQDKMNSYLALQQEDYLTAYYQFKELEAKRIPGISDSPDIAKYKNLALTGLQQSHFFISEIDDLIFRGSDGAIENTFCDFFLTKTKSGTTQAIFMDQVAQKNDRGSIVLYVKNFELLEITAFGSVVCHMSSPYAKIIPAKMPTSLNTGTNDWQSLVIMNSLSDDSATNEYTAQIFDGNSNIDATSTALIYTTVADITSILKKKHPLTDTMLKDLLNLISLQSDYGFSKKIVLAEILYRLFLPLVMFFLVFAAVYCSWQFRIQSQKRFKIRYYFFSPLFFAVLYVIINFAEYLFKCFATFLVYTANAYAGIIIFATITLLISSIVIALSCQKDS